MLPNHAQFQTPLYRAAGYGQGPQFHDGRPQVQNVANYLSGLNNAGPAPVSPMARHFGAPVPGTPAGGPGAPAPVAQAAPGSVTGLPFSPAAMAQNIAAQHPSPAGMPMPQANVQAPPSTPGGPGGPAPQSPAAAPPPPLNASAAPSISPPAFEPRVLTGAGGPTPAPPAPGQDDDGQHRGVPAVNDYMQRLRGAAYGGA